MTNVQITLIKNTFTAQDGNLISGVQITLCPMVFKFIALSKQKLDLLSEIRPDFYQWFINSPDGSVLTLSEHNTVSSHTLPDNYHVSTSLDNSLD